MGKDMTFSEITNSHKRRVSNLKIFSANSEQMFNTNLMRLGFTPASAHEFKSIGNAMFCHVSDLERYQELTNQYNERVNLHVRKDKTGEKFVRDMFIFILENQAKPFDMECFYMTSGFSFHTVETTPKFKRGLELAKQEIDKRYNRGNSVPDIFN